MSTIIRLADSHDAEAIASIYRPYVETTAISFEAVPPESDEIGRRISNTLPSYPWLVCEIDGRTAGYAYAGRHQVRAAYRWSVDTTVYVDGRFWRSGVGRGLYTSLAAVLTAQGFCNAYACIALPNPGSVALHEAVGFRPIGVFHRAGYKFGTWHDVGWWQQSLKPHEAQPKEPADLATMRNRDDWESLVTKGLPLVRGVEGVC
jgi:phosphinothricin acetyltransferase